MARKLKVYYSSGSTEEVPTIILKGKWLEKAGFNIGDYVEVKCNGDTITLTKTEPPKNKETLMDRLNKLTKKQREELLCMIEEKEN